MLHCIVCTPPTLLLGGLNLLLNLRGFLCNDKKVYKPKMFFSVMTKNLNWEILTKNLVTFKRWDGG